MSSAVAQHGSALAVGTSLADRRPAERDRRVGGRRPLRRGRWDASPRDERPSDRPDRLWPSDRRDGRGNRRCVARLAGPTTRQSSWLHPPRSGRRDGGHVASGSDTASPPHSRRRRRAGHVPARLLRGLRVPRRSARGSPREVAAGGDGAVLPDGVRPLSLLLARRRRRSTARRVHRGLPGERIHDRRQADDRGVLRQRWVVRRDRDHVRDTRLPDLSHGNSQSAAEARAPARVPSRTRAHGSAPDLPRGRHAVAAPRRAHDLGRGLGCDHRPVRASVRIPAGDRAVDVLRRNRPEGDRRADWSRAQTPRSCARPWPRRSTIRHSSWHSRSTEPEASSTRTAGRSRRCRRPAVPRPRSIATATRWR